MKPRLGVNIDHVATLRQARGENYPSLAKAAEISLDAGADQITIHLREDRRHIQDHDVPLIKEVVQKKGKLLNFEMATASEIVKIAKAVKPDWVCLVPEKREERTTEGGLNLSDRKVFDSIKRTIDELKSSDSNVQISLFVEADRIILEKCLALNANAVEIHTGDFAHSFNKRQPLDIHLSKFEESYHFCKKNKLSFHAGHGLTFSMMEELLSKQYFSEYNIGHWIICESVFNGLYQVVNDMRSLFDQYETK